MEIMSLRVIKRVINIILLFSIAFFSNGCISNKVALKIDEKYISEFLSFFVDSLNLEEDFIVLRDISDNEWYDFVSILNENNKPHCHKMQWKKEYLNEAVFENLTKYDYAYIKRQLTTLMFFKKDNFETKKKVVMTSSLFKNYRDNYNNLKKRALTLSKPIFSIKNKYAFIKLKTDTGDSFFYVYKYQRNTWGLIGKYVLTNSSS